MLTLVAACQQARSCPRRATSLHPIPCWDPTPACYACLRREMAKRAAEVDERTSGVPCAQKRVCALTSAIIGHGDRAVTADIVGRNHQLMPVIERGQKVSITRYAHGQRDATRLADAKRVVIEEVPPPGNIAMRFGLHGQDGEVCPVNESDLPGHG